MIAAGRERLKRFSEKPWFYPVALLFMGLAVYEYALPYMGFSWDDWEIVMFTKLNPALQPGFYQHDRPFPWTYHLTYFLVGSNPIGWHIVTLLYRWAGVLLIVYALSILWPRYEAHFRWLGALLLFYPGFLQQSQAATKDRHIATFFVFALSIYLMLLALKHVKWARILFPLSWLATFIQLFTTEYFSGLELLRPILLWIYLRQNNKDEKIPRTLRRGVVNYIPYFLITVFYFWCRFIYFPILFDKASRVGAIKSLLGGLQQSFGGTLLEVFSRAATDFIYLNWQVWIDSILNFDGFTFQSRVAWFAFGLGVLLAVFFAFFHNTKERESSDAAAPAVIFLVGLIAFMLGALPIWAIGRQISAGGWADRYALAPMLGACIMAVALIFWVVRPFAQRLLLTVLLVFSIAAQVWVVNVYRLDWRVQRDFYWQLYWRAPALKSGTAVFSFEQPSPSVTHYADAGYALNVLYHYQTGNGVLPYWYYPRRFHFQYEPGIPLKYSLRNLEFRGNTSDGIAVLHQTSSSCLLVLDTVYADNPLFTEGQNVLIPISNLSRIIPDPKAAPPDPDIFGTEPAYDWCYFFEKADLARQTNEWKSITALYQQAQKQKLQPGFGGEYIPFIEAYARTGNWQKAYALTLSAQKETPGVKKMLCATWLRLSTIPSANGKVVGQAKQALSCPDS